VFVWCRNAVTEACKTFILQPQIRWTANYDYSAILYIVTGVEDGMFYNFLLAWLICRDNQIWTCLCFLWHCCVTYCQCCFNMVVLQWLSIQTHLCNFQELLALWWWLHILHTLSFNYGLTDNYSKHEMYVLFSLTLK
jgi:hypothetical protein